MDIEIVRGTTNTFVVSIKYEDGTPYTPKPGDFAVFGIKKLSTDGDLLITKKATIQSDGSAEFTILPEDTENLCCAKYVYDISVESGSDFINVIERSVFYISNNVTSKGCAK